MDTLKILSAIILSISIGCASYTASENLSKPSKSSYELDRELWQKAIDKVVVANFPQKKFRGSVSTYPFMHSWGSSKGTLSITAKFLNDLNGFQRINMDSKLVAVAAHEIAHLILDHHQSTEWMKIQKILASYPENRFDELSLNKLKKLVGELDMAADKLAINLFFKAGYSTDEYLNMLNWIQGNMVNIDQLGAYLIPSSTKERIQAAVVFRNKQTTN